MNLIDECDGTVLVTSPDFPELTTFGAVRAAPLAHAVRASEEAIASASLARMDVPRPTNARGGSCVYLATLKVAKLMLYRAMRDAQVQQTRVGASSELALCAGRSRARPEPRLAAGPDRRGARGRRPAVGRSWRRRHTLGFTCGCDERWWLTVTVAAAADLDAAGETPEGALPRHDRIPGYQRKLTAYSWIASVGVGIVAVATRTAGTRRRSNGS